MLRVRPKIGTAPPTVDQLVAARNGAAGAEGTLLSQGAGNPTGAAVLQVALQIDARRIAGGETRRTGNRRADPILTTLTRGASLAAAAAMGGIKARVGAEAVAEGGPYGAAARSVHAAALGGADIAAATAVGAIGREVYLAAVERVAVAVGATGGARERARAADASRRFMFFIPTATTRFRPG